MSDDFMENNNMRYVLIAVIIFIVLALLIWAIWYMTRPASPPPAPTAPSAASPNVVKDQIPTAATLTPISGETTGQTVEKTFPTSDNNKPSENVVDEKNGASLDEILASSSSAVSSPPKSAAVNKKIKLPVKNK